MSQSAAAAFPSTAAPVATTVQPYPNALQARQTTDAHRRIAAAAVRAYQDSLAEEQARLERDGIVLSEEETARLQQRVAMQESANATATQFRQRACEVVMSTEDVDEHHNDSPTNPADNIIDVYHAACDGDVGALTAWVARVPPALLSVRINAVGQPDPRKYNGVQLQQRWLFRAPPLVYAAAFGREDAVAFLLAHGADVNVKSSTGLRAVDYAAMRGYTTIAAMLRGS
jgi:hypothetical protein